ncbi:MAG: hypothetical protein IJF13_09785 [Clostridia bacterium]|nr:hypothetical protein [Clostridia bacterium]
MEKIKKDLLTEENIKSDLMVTSYAGVEKKHEPLYYLVYVLFGISFVLAYFLRSPWYLFIGPIAYLITPFIVLIKDTVKHKRRKQAILGSGFTVREDTLSHVNLESVPASHSRRMLSKNTAFGIEEKYVFHFNGCDWEAPKGVGNLYNWSENYYMSLEGIYNTSLMGDEFYIVERNLDGEIGCIYNKKFFEYKKKEADNK